jgi:DNA-directed RNA polymerase specialized sigma subunit
MLSTASHVIWSLVTYTDWWQPSSASVLLVGAARRSNARSDGMHPGLLETLDERSELCRRIAKLDERERQVLFLWYVRQLPVKEIAAVLDLSARQCQRLRAKAVKTIVDLGAEEQAA